MLANRDDQRLDDRTYDPSRDTDDGTGKRKGDKKNKMRGRKDKYYE